MAGAKGILDVSNRESLLADAATPVAIGSRYRFAWATFPNDFVFAAGHRIGIILVANCTSFSSLAGATGSTVTPDTRVSKVRLPTVGRLRRGGRLGRIRRQVMTLRARTC